ncbi:MAG TPA: thrombospondin type 3 repeat-containing protein, partial [candidate division Zixibacteria bacterium]|nr:thrombospondin type 3 repeat-containing protein [candidate division Zixibacteria bacterium]
VAGRVDANGDGVFDIVSGEPRTGRTLIHSGLNGLLLQTFSEDDPGGADFYGRYLANAGDINADGDNDLVVGAIWSDSGGVDAGRGYVYIIGDPDQDGIQSVCDVCPTTAPAVDLDLDCVVNGSDNCPEHYNPLQEDLDGDGFGDSCFVPAQLNPLTVVARYSAPEPPGAGAPLPPGDPEVNVTIVDPDGLIFGADSLGSITNTIGAGVTYDQINGEDSLVIAQTKTGEYTILIVSEAGSSLSSSYTIGIRTDGTVEERFGPFTAPLSGTVDTLMHTTTSLIVDTDGDGFVDTIDNCPMDANPGQEDIDGDNIGDICDLCPSVHDTLDADNDCIENGLDNCPVDYNPAQEDFDNDGLGDSCYLPTYLTPFTVVATEDNPAVPPGNPECNLWITDPDSLVIGADAAGVITNTIGASAAYYQVDGNDSVVINDPKSGIYSIIAIGEDGSSASGLYTIGIRTDGTVEERLGPFVKLISGAEDTVVAYQATPYAFGDCDGSRSVNIADATRLIAIIFSGAPFCEPAESGDADCSGSVNIADVTYLLAYIFTSGPAPGC